MPYSSNGRLPIELASKLGHLEIVKNQWIKDILSDFESIEFNSTNVEKWIPLEKDEVDVNHLWVVDGSIAEVKSELNGKKKVAFIKAALLKIDCNKLDEIDPRYPHPERLKSILDDNTFFVSTVFPLEYINSSYGSNSDAIRTIIFETLKTQHEGIFLETLKWLIYRKWNSECSSSSSFKCPNCNMDIEGMPYDSEKILCNNCNKNIYLTDSLSFHLDMSIDEAPSSIAMRFMSVLEHLMILTPIRLLIQKDSRKVIKNSVFIKDGPLMLPSQYSRLIPSIREFMEFIFSKNFELKLLGQEKTGRIVEYLNMSVESCIKREFKYPLYKILKREDVHKEVMKRDEITHVYGERTNWGEKVLLIKDPFNSYVVNVVSDSYADERGFPVNENLPYLKDILNLILKIGSVRHENALYPIEVANNIASLSDYPSKKTLSAYLDKLTSK